MEDHDEIVDVITLATNAVQAQERLLLALKTQKVETAQKHVNLEVKKQTTSLLENARTVKGMLEGTCIKWTAFDFPPENLMYLKQLSLMHVPGSFDEIMRAEFENLINGCFQGKCQRLLFSAICTCPWYRASQYERGQQAKHNIIFIVFVSKTDEYFCPVDLHKKEENSVVDLGWLYAVEISHFARYLAKGKTRFVEAVFLPECAVIYQSQDWQMLLNQLDNNKIIGLRGFLEECRGQAVGRIGKKNKKGYFKLKGSATLYDFCGSCRLLQHAVHSLHHEKLNLLSTDKASHPLAEETVKIITALYKEDRNYTKDHLFDIILRWKRMIDEKMVDTKFTQPPVIEHVVGSWLMHVYLEGRILRNPQAIDEKKRTLLISYMNKIGGSVAKLDPTQILMIAQAGSHLYNLATPQSDQDFVVVYAEKPENVYSSCGRLKECTESRGPEKEFEYGAYEVRLFCEMLWKGSVVILELLFADGLEYTSESWEELATNKRAFITETAIRQYLGLIKNNIVMIENKKHMNSSRERKLFYQIFHKLYSLDYFLHGEAPPVRCTEEQREFIMKIRTQPLEGEFSRLNLYDTLMKRLGTLKQLLAARTKRLPENADPQFLVDWIKKIRCWPEQDVKVE